MDSMNMVRLAYNVLLSASLVCAVLLMTYSYKRRTMPGARYFFMLMITAIIYNSGYIGEINSVKLSTDMFWSGFEHIAIPFEHYFWLMMSLEYVGIRKKYFNIAKYAGLYHPVLYWLVYYTNDIHHLYFVTYKLESNGYFNVLISQKGPLYMLMVASGTFLAIVAMAAYIYGCFRSSRLYRYGYIVMIFASVIPWFTVYLDATNTDYMGIDYFPVVTIISAGLYAYGIFKFRIFNTIPIATETVFRQSKEGIMLIDIGDHIIDVNDAMIKLYPEIKNIPVKYTFTSFIESHPEIKYAFNENEKFQYKLKRNDDMQYYSAEVTSILAEKGIKIGKILTVSDITLFISYEEKLKTIASNAINKAETNEISFLHAQISPHFLNNTLSVIASMVTREPYKAKELISNLSEYLMDCYLFDDSSVMIPLQKELETINTYVAIEKARFRERLNFNIVCDNVPQIYIPRLILQPLVENAIRHGILKKSEGGNVYLKIILKGNEVYFEIKDDGVGIREEKIKEILNDNSSKKGVGISNIHRRLMKYYGQGLNVQSTEGQGTTIFFSIPFNTKS